MRIRDTLEQEWAASIDGQAAHWGAVVNLMDDELREQIHLAHAPCSEREFFDIYSALDGGALESITQW